MSGLSLVTILVTYVALLFSLSVHEASHATAAYLLGDDTAARMGRMTLNPLAHIEPFGTVIFPLLGLILGGFFIGWAKPVPYNPANFSRKIRMKAGGALVSLAGPASNVILSFLFLLLLCLAARSFSPMPEIRWNILEAAFRGPETLSGMGMGPGQQALFSLGASLVTLNVLLAAFNILPLGPLDGAGVLRGLLPDRWLPTYDRYRYHRFTMPILFVLMITGLIGVLLNPVRSLLYLSLNPVAHVLLGA